MAVPDMTTRADEIDDSMLLLARVGYRAYQIFRGEMMASIADFEMTADLDRLADLLNAQDNRRDAD